ncbi:MAG: hypothetical protein OXE76_04645 [Alphaproteobacteria bacterium]|nr:hypothetical protein [Alphaproteobacteria bacterium]
MVPEKKDGGRSAQDDERPEDDLLAKKGSASVPVEDAFDYAHCTGFSLVMSLILLPALLIALPFAPAIGVYVPETEELVSMMVLYGFLWVIAIRLSVARVNAQRPFLCETLKTLLVWRGIALLGGAAWAGWTTGGSSAAVFPLLTVGAWLGAVVEGAGLAIVARQANTSLARAASVSLRAAFAGGEWTGTRRDAFE